VPGSGGSVSVTRQRRAVPIDAWLADDPRAVVGLQMVGAGESCWTGEALFRTGVGGVGI